jgi:hypothetical protein
LLVPPLLPVKYKEAVFVTVAPPAVTVPIGFTTKFASIACVPVAAVVTGAEPIIKLEYELPANIVLEVLPLNIALPLTLVAPLNNKLAVAPKLVIEFPVAKKPCVELVVVCTPPPSKLDPPFTQRA